MTITYGSVTRLNWRCKNPNCGRLFGASVNNRTKGGTGCPCRGQNNVMRLVNPVMYAELDLDSNPGQLWLTQDIDLEWLTIKSSKKVSWRCKDPSCGLLYQETPANRSDGQGCPHCRERNRQYLHLTNPDIFAELAVDANPGSL